jgi:GDPmannose 4,6-dehydratase
MGGSALILGVTGQDGSYLAEHLTALGWRVWGMVRGQPEAHPRHDWLRSLLPDLQLVGGDLLDAGSLREAIRGQGFEVIYNLAAVSSPGQAWQQPVLTGEVTGLGVTRLLDVVRNLRPWVRVVQAGSIATHGPYGAAKTYARAVCEDYRQRGMLVSTVLFGGHHSPRRSPAYFSRKVTKAVAEIAAGRRDDLWLGSLVRSQDWGWADNFVTALPEIAAMEPGEYTVSTGEPRTCQEWVEAAFTAADLDWREHVRLDKRAGNVTDVPLLSAAPDERLIWRPRRDFTELVSSMVEADLTRVGVRA